jgi:hypothetical protein
MQQPLIRSILIFLFGATILIACQGVDQPPAPAGATATPAGQVSPLSAAESPLAATSPLAVPSELAEGKSLVVGRLFSQGSGEPLNRGLVRLAEVYCPEGINDEDKANECFWTLANAGSPSTFTDENGYFEFRDVEARDYVIIVGDLMGQHAFAYKDERDLYIFTARANEVTDVGEHHVNY